MVSLQVLLLRLLLLLLILRTSCVAGWISRSTSNVGRVPVPQLSQPCSKVGCGTWSWGNRLLFDYSTDQDAELYETYAILRDAGVTLFDTADSYGTLDLNGRAETLLGQFERQYQNQNNNKNKNNQVQIATKFAPYPWRLSSGSIVNAARESLRRLNDDDNNSSGIPSLLQTTTTKLTLAQAHWSTARYLPAQETAIWKGLGDAYSEGLCEAVGVSNYGPRQLRAIYEYYRNDYTYTNKNNNGIRQSTPPLATAQVQYSLLTYQAAQGYTDVCRELGDIQCLAYSPLCLGLLTGKYNRDSIANIKGPRRNLFTELLPSAEPLISLMQAMANDRKNTNTSVSQIAILWCQQQGTIPLVGCRTPNQARELVQTFTQTRNLSASEMNALSRAALAVPKPMIQNIFQTR